MANVPCSRRLARVLSSTCGVCGSPAPDVRHYGAVVCYSCRAFFRRSVRAGAEYGPCVRGTERCLVDSFSRTNCRPCRLRRCREEGMQQDRVERREAGGSSGISSGRGDSSDIGSSSGSSPNPGTLEKSVPCMPTLSLQVAPTLHLTFEEEFKISELMVRKDFLMDGVVDAISEKIPHFQDTFIQYAEGLPRDFVDSSDRNSFGFGSNPRGLNDLVEEHCRPDGRIRACLEMFDEYKHVDDNVKLEIFTFSMQVVGLCIRAFLSANSHLPSFVEQHKAAGQFTPRIQHMYYSKFKNTRLPPNDPLSSSKFSHPWARRPQDEHFFISTLSKVGSLVGEDVTLGCLYTTLVLASPGPLLSSSARVQPSLARVRLDMELLIFRYLKQKFNCSVQANHTLTGLLSMVGALHASHEIHINCRLPRDGPAAT